jgi:hypothetical protein
MALKGIPVDSANPKLPDVVIDATKATSASALTATADDEFLTPAIAAVRDEKYDVRRSGCTPGTTDDNTTALASAVTTVSAAGGGKLWWSGDLYAQQVTMQSNCGIYGLGKNRTRLVHHTARAAGEHLIVLATDATNVSLEHFGIHGQFASQTGEANAIHLSNSAGSSSLLAQHQVRDVHIESVKGVGLYLGAFIRRTTIDGMTIYFCDTYGVHAVAPADMSVTNVDVGQSGLEGWFMENPSSMRWSNLKSWFSGRLVSGSNGFYLRNGGGNTFKAIQSQENSGSGFFAWGQSGALKGLVISGYTSDSDNVVAGSHYGLRLANVTGAVVDFEVWDFGGAGGPVNAGLAVDTGTTRCNIRMAYDTAAVTWPVLGTDIGANQIDIGQSASAPAYATPLTPNPYSFREYRMTLTGNLTINAPTANATAPPVDFPLRFVLTQDATGGRTITLNAAYKVPATAVVDTTLNTTTIYEFVCHANTVWRLASFVTGIPA